MKITRLLLLCLCPLFFLSGCMTLSSQAPVSTWQGRFSATIEGIEGQQSQRGRFELSTYVDNDTILDIKSPIGGTVARIELREDLARFQALGHESVETTDLHSLMMKTLGFSVPVDNLTYWIEGLPNPNEPSSVLADNRFEQNGWQIEVLAKNEENLPTRLKVLRLPTPTEPKIVITLLIQGHSRHDRK